MDPTNAAIAGIFGIDPQQLAGMRVPSAPGPFDISALYRPAPQSGGFTQPSTQIGWPELNGINPTDMNTMSAEDKLKAIQQRGGGDWDEIGPIFNQGFREHFGNTP